MKFEGLNKEKVMLLEGMIDDISDDMEKLKGFTANRRLIQCLRLNISFQEKLSIIIMNYLAVKLQKLCLVIIQIENYVKL